MKLSPFKILVLAFLLIFINQCKSINKKYSNNKYSKTDTCHSSIKQFIDFVESKGFKGKLQYKLSGIIPKTTEVVSYVYENETEKVYTNVFAFLTKKDAAQFISTNNNSKNFSKGFTQNSCFVLYSGGAKFKNLFSKY